MMALALSNQEAVRSRTKVMAVRYQQGDFARGPVSKELVMHWTVMETERRKTDKSCWMHFGPILTLTPITSVLPSRLPGFRSSPPTLHNHLKATPVSVTLAPPSSGSTYGQSRPQVSPPRTVSEQVSCCSKHLGAASSRQRFYNRHALCLVPTAL